MRRLLIGVIVLMAVHTAFGQGDDLSVTDVTVSAQVDAFGVEQQVAIGTVTNTAADTAFADVQVFAEIYDADDDIIGEGFGFIVNQCGKSAPPDFVLQPDAAQRFVTPLEFYGDETDYERIAYFPQGRSVAPSGDDTDPINGVIPIANREIAGLEWAVDTTEDGAQDITLLYAEGCYRDVFTAQDWYEYDPATDTTQAIEHPRAAEATDPETRERLGLTDDTLYNRSYLSFPPNGGSRLVYQDNINSLFTAEPNGTFRRLLDEELFRSTLQGIYWLPEERFVAYYYGGYGDGVTYLVASSAGAYFSTPERFSVPSVTVPGALPDVSRLIVSGTFNDDETPGYYLKQPAAELFERLFEWENLPGNNYPAPVYRSRGGLQTEDVIYFALPDANDAPRLHCYDRREGALFDLAPLPLELGTEDRAYMRLSPDNATIALGANGMNGGLWLLDLGAFDHCAN